MRALSKPRTSSKGAKPPTTTSTSSSVTSNGPLCQRLITDTSTTNLVCRCKKVIESDGMTLEGKSFHIQCFKCSKCNKLIDPGKVSCRVAEDSVSYFS